MESSSRGRTALFPGVSIEFAAYMTDNTLLQVCLRGQNSKFYFCGGRKMGYGTQGVKNVSDKQVDFSHTRYKKPAITRNRKHIVQKFSASLQLTKETGWSIAKMT